MRSEQDFSEETLRVASPLRPYHPAAPSKAFHLLSSAHRPSYKERQGCLQHINYQVKTIRPVFLASYAKFTTHFPILLHPSQPPPAAPPKTKTIDQNNNNNTLFVGFFYVCMHFRGL